jgi:CMP-N,N'-diacetyllegionaminic acid synthase
MIVALIPARGGSKRIPFKNLKEFCGVNLFLWSVKQAQASRVDRVIVSTDDTVIAAYSKVNQAEVLVRPPELSGGNTTIEEVVAHCVEACSLKDDDLVVVLQPTSPLRKSDDIDNAIKMWGRHGGMESFGIASYVKTTDLFVASKWGIPLTYISKPRKALECWIETGSIYVSQAKNWTRYPVMIEHEPWQNWELDELWQWEVGELLMMSHIYKEEGGQ